MSLPCRLVAAIVLAASLLGCNGAVGPGATDDGESVGPISQIDACSLLSQAEIQAAIGKPVKPGIKEEMGGNATGCDWEGQNDADAIAITLSVDEFDQEFWDAEKNGEGVEPMPGIGEEAIRGWITTSLVLIKHRNMEIALTVIAVYQDDAAVKSTQETLGKLVVSRL